MRKLFLAGLLILPLPGQQKDTPVAPVPQITAEQRARFWRSQTEAILAAAQAQKAVEQARKAQEALATLRKEICGDAFEVAADANGEPSCQARSDKDKK